VRSPPPAEQARFERLVAELEAVAIRDSSPDRLRVRALVALYSGSRGRGAQGPALSALDEAVLCAGRLGDRALEARALIAAAERAMDDGQVGPALERATRAASLAPEDVRPSLGARALELEAILLRSMSRFDEAVERGERAVRLHRAAGDLLGEGAALTQRATALYGAGRIAEAHEEVARARVLLARACDPRLEAIALAVMASIQHYSGRGGDPAPLYQEAADAYLAVGDRRSLSSLWLNLGALHGDRGARAEAADFLGRSLALAREIGDAAREAGALHRLAYLDLEQGSLDQADRRLRDALAMHEEMGNREHAADAALGLGLVAHEREQLGEARAWYDRSALANADRVLPEGFAAAALADADQLAIAAERLAAARQQASTGWFRTFVDTIDGFVAAGRARAVAHDREAAAALLAGADATCAGAAATTRVHLRLAARLLARAIARSRRRVDSARTPDLEVAADGRWFALAGGPPVAMGRRHASRLVLRRLVEQRLTAPGAGLSVDEVLAAGWPGEKILHESGQARVRNVMRELRELGLRDCLLTQDDGYLLAPGLEVAWRDPA
jgi:tetratricopeptide (TPR) repeat protein